MPTSQKALSAALAQRHKAAIKESCLSENFAPGAIFTRSSAVTAALYCGSTAARRKRGLLKRSRTVTKQILKQSPKRVENSPHKESPADGQRKTSATMASRRQRQTTEADDGTKRQKQKTAEAPPFEKKTKSEKKYEINGGESLHHPEQKRKRRERHSPRAADEKSAASGE